MICWRWPVTLPGKSAESSFPGRAAGWNILSPPAKAPRPVSGTTRRRTNGSAFSREKPFWNWRAGRSRSGGGKVFSFPLTAATGWRPPPLTRRLYGFVYFSVWKRRDLSFGKPLPPSTERPFFRLFPRKWTFWFAFFHFRKLHKLLPFRPVRAEGFPFCNQEGGEIPFK